MVMLPKLDCQPVVDNYDLHDNNSRVMCATSTIAVWGPSSQPVQVVKGHRLPTSVHISSPQPCPPSTSRLLRPLPLAPPGIRRALVNTLNLTGLVPAQYRFKF